MRIRQLTLPLLAALVAGTGCKKNDPVEMPPPVGPSSPSSPPTNPPPPPPPASDNSAAAIEAARSALVNTLAEQVYFEFNRSDIRPQDQAVLNAKVAILNRHPQVRIRISGHADERGSDEYNMVLGNQRALAAKAYLERQGIAGSRIDVISFGEERPADPSSNEAAWARNRRGEFEVTAGRDQLGTLR